MTDPIALAQLRHLYQNMVNGAVRDTASAKRIAEGLLAPTIEALERGDLKEQAVAKPTYWTNMLPCPFCGGSPTTIVRPDNIDGTQFFFAIACYCGRHSACAHKMAVRKTPEIAKADAIAAWNTRTLQPDQAKEGGAQ